VNWFTADCLKSEESARLRTHDRTSIERCRNSEIATHFLTVAATLMLLAKAHAQLREEQAGKLVI
jgi:hypothetical protein